MDLIPRPTSFRQHDGRLGLTNLTPPSGPAEIVELAVEVLGARATGAFGIDDSASDLNELTGPLVVKALVPASRKALGGGVRFAQDGYDIAF